MSGKGRLTRPTAQKAWDPPNSQEIVDKESVTSNVGDMDDTPNGARHLLSEMQSIKDTCTVVQLYKIRLLGQGYWAVK